jgi:hypothetical protein
MQGMDLDFDNFEIDDDDFESEVIKVEVGDNFVVILDELENGDPFLCHFMWQCITIHSDIHFLCHKYTLESYNISWEKKFFSSEFFVLWSTILCKEFGKICSKITMVEVQTWTPLENSTM